MRSLEKTGDFTETPAADGSGTYYVLRYALDSEPYYIEKDWVKTAFADLPAAASVFVYRRQLLALKDSVTVGSPVETQTVAAAIACQTYNAIRMLNR